MEIPKHQFFKQIPQQVREDAKLSIPAAMLFIRRHFCSPLTTKGLCSTECSNCRENILEAMSGMEHLSETKGMFVQRLRHTVASLEEARSDAQKVESSAFEDETGDLFEKAFAL